MEIDNNQIKLLVLWDILYNQTDENHALNADELQEELQKRGISVIPRVIASNIRTLNKAGYEVAQVRKKHIYYYVDNTIPHNNIRFSCDDIVWYGCNFFVFGVS